MTKSEVKARNWLKKVYPNGYIRKIPDFKATGSPLLRGLPDYFVIDKGLTYWVEVKFIHGYRFDFSELREAQWIEFVKFLDAGYDVQILVVYEISGRYLFKMLNFSDLYRKIGHKSLQFTLL